MNSFNIYNPLEQFEIQQFISFIFPIFGYFQVSLTNYGLYCLFTLFLVLLVFNIGGNRIIINRWSLIPESLYQTVHNMSRVQIGSGSKDKYFPFIFSLFTFILGANIISLIPYSFAITSHFIFTLSLSLAILIGVTILGFSIHGLRFFSIIVPSGAPIFLLPFLILLEIISYFAKGLSHGLRLAINILAGHCLMFIIAGFIFTLFSSSLLGLLFTPITILLLIAIFALELAIAFIQAYVFSLLASSYIKDSLDLH